MPMAFKADKPCPSCGPDTDVWVFEKDEGSMVKMCYSCDECGGEWSEWLNWDERE